MRTLILFVSWIATWIGVTLFLHRKGYSGSVGFGGGFVVSCGVLVLVSMLLTDQTKEAQRTQLTVKKADLGSAQRKEPKARNDGRKVTARQDDDKWSFPVASGEPECIDKAAVILNTPSGSYLVNGTAMDRYGNTYNSREIGMPVPGLANDPRAKLPPPHELIQHGLKLCD
jgi:hypothetical protein